MGPGRIGSKYHSSGAGGVVEFRFECPTAKLVGVAGFFDVASISGYIRQTY
jgi:hypothetical protein